MSTDAPTHSKASSGPVYWIGCFSGFGIAAGLVLSWFAFTFADLRGTYAEFGGTIPTVTSVVTHPFYLRAIPVAVLAAVLLGNVWVKKPRTLLVLLAVTSLVAAIAVVVGYWGARYPFTQLAGNISAN